MAERIYLSPPDVTDIEEQSVVRAMRSGWIAPLGPEVDAFEAELAGYCGRAHAVALSSGTAALHLGLLSLGVRPGDLVLTSTMTFAATANAVVYTGAEPVLVDCDETGNMSPELGPVYTLAPPGDLIWEIVGVSGAETAAVIADTVAGFDEVPDGADGQISDFLDVLISRGLLERL